MLSGNIRESEGVLGEDINGTIGDLELEQGESNMPREFKTNQSPKKSDGVILQEVSSFESALIVRWMVKKTSLNPRSGI